MKTLDIGRTANAALAASIMASAQPKPFILGQDLPHEGITTANASLFVQAHFSEPLTTYATGWRDPASLDALCEFIAPTLPGTGERYEHITYPNAEAFLSDVNADDDLRAIGGDFKAVDYTQAKSERTVPNRGLLYDAYSHIYAEQQPDATILVAQSVSATGGTPDRALFTFAKEDFEAVDWTDETWPDGPTPPAVPPEGGPGESGAATFAPPFTPGDGSDGSWFASTSGALPPGGSGVRPIVLPPNDPPSAEPPTITITFATTYNPTAPACVRPELVGTTATVIMTVAIVGGPAGTYGYTCNLGSYSPDGGATGNAYAGWTRDFTFHVPIAAAGSLTPAFAYHLTGGDATKSTPNFTFPPACIPVTLRFIAEAEITSYGGYDDELSEYYDPLYSYTIAYDFTADYLVAPVNGTLRPCYLAGSAGSQVFDLTYNIDEAGEEIETAECPNSPSPGVLITVAMPGGTVSAPLLADIHAKGPEFEAALEAAEMAADGMNLFAISDGSVTVEIVP